MTRDEAETIARASLAQLANRDTSGHNADWSELAGAAARALAGDRSAAAVFRKVFEHPGFAVSNSCVEVGLAALGIGLCGDRDGLRCFATTSMPFNGIDEHLRAARVLLDTV